MAGVHAIVFDFDLTLVDSRKGFIDAHEFARKRLGLPPIGDDAEVRTIGTPLPDAFRRLYPAHVDKLAEFVDIWQTRADESMTGLTSVLAGAPGAVRSLAGAGYALAIVSQKWRYRIEAVLEREGLLDCFSVIIGGDDAPEFKPDPRGILMALERLGAGRHETIYVGDTVIDAQAAANAGLPFVAVLTGFAVRDDFAAVPSLAVLPSVDDLPRFLAAAP